MCESHEESDVLVLALSSVSACASTTKLFGGRPDPTAQHGEKSQRFAAAEPTTPAGAQEINAEDKALYKEMADWTQTLKSNGHGHRDPEVQKILRSREAFIVKVGDRLSITPSEKDKPVCRRLSSEPTRWLFRLL